MTNVKPPSSADSFATSKDTITLVSKENEMVPVAVKAISLCKTIADMLEGSTDLNENIPVPIVPTSTLKKIVSWCEHYQYDADMRKKCCEPDEDEWVSQKSKTVTPFEEQLIGSDHDEIFSILIATNFLNVQPLLDAACKTVANMITGRTPEEIRKMFDIPNDFTPEEEDKCRQEFAWLQDHDHKQSA